MGTQTRSEQLEYYMGTVPSKWTLYKTAIVSIGAAGVREGDVVAIQHYSFHGGSHWFMVTATERGPIAPVCFPDHQLHSFVL